MNQIIITFFTIAIGIMPFFASGVRESSTLELLHFVIIIINSVSIFLLYQERFYSLFKIFHLFSYFFLGVAPITQFKDNITFWDAPNVQDQEYIYTSLLILVSLIMYNFFYRMLNNISTPYFLLSIYNSFFSDRLLKAKKRNFFTLVFLSFFILILVCWTRDFNYVNIFYRSDIESLVAEINDSSKVEALLVNNFIRPMSAIAFMFSFFYRVNKFTIILLFVFLIITCSPTGVSRYFAATVYIPVVMLIFPVLRKKNIFVLMMIAGVMIIFPLLEYFRVFGKTTEDFVLSTGFDLFKEAHFDAYANFVQLINVDLVSNGNQLLGVIFFFIPRAVWPTKPIGSGAELAEKVGLSLSNISCNLFAEGYINFGYFGVILFVFIVSYVTAMLDKVYWANIKQFRYNFFSIIYLMLLGLLFFVLRGDLLSSWSIICGFTASAVLIYKIYNKKVILDKIPTKLLKNVKR